MASLMREEHSAIMVFKLFSLLSYSLVPSPTQCNHI